MSEGTQKTGEYPILIVSGKRSCWPAAKMEDGFAGSGISVSEENGRRFNSLSEAAEFLEKTQEIIRPVTIHPVTEANHTDREASETDHTNREVIEASRTDREVIEADRVDMKIIEADRVDMKIIEADYVDMKIIEADYANRETGCQADISHSVTVFLANGIYPGQVTFSRPHLTLIGQSPSETILAGSLFARMPRADIGKLGTFRSYTCRIAADDVTVKNLTFRNSAGPGHRVGQALALYADGDGLTFENCRFLGSQDTLFTAPLPPKEIEPNGFVGPGQFAPRRNGRHYYKNCYFEGDIDFIFGGATAYFENCEFHSLDPRRGMRDSLPAQGQNCAAPKPDYGYVTAASTPQGQAYGYVMKNCRFTGDGPPHSAYLGRPWREYAQVVLLDCWIGSHICEEGWHDWNKPEARETAFFAEYGSYGPSGDMTKRPGWVNRLTQAEAQSYTKERVIGCRINNPF